MIKLVGIQSADIENVWQIVADDIERFTARTGGRYDPETIKQSLKDRRRQLWTVWEGRALLAVAVTEICVWDTGVKSLLLLGTAGRDFRKWFHLIEPLERFAVEKGCAFLEICGRKGWDRVHDNYKQTEITLERRL